MESSRAYRQPRLYRGRLPREGQAAEAEPRSFLSTVSLGICQIALARPQDGLASRFERSDDLRAPILL